MFIKIFSFVTKISTDFLGTRDHSKSQSHDERHFMNILFSCAYFEKSIGHSLSSLFRRRSFSLALCASQMDVTFRETRKRDPEDEAEVLDQDQQQRVIDELEENYKQMVRTQEIAFTGIIGFASAACLVIGYISGLHIPFLLSSFAFMALIPCHMLNKRWLWGLAISLEVVAIVSAVLNVAETGVGMWIGLHGVYFLVVFFFFSSQKFVKSMPERIQNLHKLKYGAKLA